MSPTPIPAVGLTCVDGTRVVVGVGTPLLAAAHCGSRLLAARALLNTQRGGREAERDRETSSEPGAEGTKPATVPGVPAAAPSCPLAASSLQRPCSAAALFWVENAESREWAGGEGTWPCHGSGAAGVENPGGPHSCPVPVAGTGGEGGSPWMDHGDDGLDLSSPKSSNRGLAGGLCLLGTKTPCPHGSVPAVSSLICSPSVPMLLADCVQPSLCRRTA